MAREDTAVVEKLRSKILYKAELYLIKTIPIIISGLAVLNTVLSYYHIDAPILSYIGGVSILTLAFLYVSSYVFKFCAWHRVFIHYVTLNWILNIADYYYGIPVKDKTLFILHLCLAGVFLFIALYVRIQFKKHC